MSSGTDQVLEGVIIDDGHLLYSAREHQRFVNLTHAMVFLKHDPHLAEICAKRAYDVMRQHLKECFQALAHETAPDAVEDI